MRNQILSWVRALGLMPMLDRLRMYWFAIKNKRSNATFLEKHPSFQLPSDTILYETYQLDYQQYYSDGQQVAQEIWAIATKYQILEPCQILDWGCGPARVVRHFPKLLDGDSEVFASDFNEKTITWCNLNIKDVYFHHNQLKPPMDFADEMFDLVYAISVLTHLSIDNQHNWIQEMHRLLKHKALLILTTQGEAFAHKLDKSELDLFKSGQPIIRKGGSEGRRTFSSFHPTRFLQDLFEDFQILEHRPGQREGPKIEQDLWVLQKVD